MSINYYQLLNCLSSCRTERRKYYKHINKARTHPDKYISLIIDGMDQHTTAIPKFNNTPKAASTIQKTTDTRHRSHRPRQRPAHLHRLQRTPPRLKSNNQHPPPHPQQIQRQPTTCALPPA